MVMLANNTGGIEWARVVKLRNELEDAVDAMKGARQ